MSNFCPNVVLTYVAILYVEGIKQKLLKKIFSCNRKDVVVNLALPKSTCVRHWTEETRYAPRFSETYV